MVRSIFILLVLFIVSCGNPNKTQNTSPENKDSSTTIAKTKGGTLPEQHNVAIPDGPYEERYKGGLLKIKGYYLKGQRHGQWASFYEDGNLWSEQQYSNGKRDGVNISYYPNGKKRYEGLYKNDESVGVWKYYNEDGSLAQEVNNNKK